MRYLVKLTRTETAHCNIEVEATSPDEAKRMAIEEYGNSNGEYEFRLCDEGCSVSDIDIHHEPEELP